MTRPFAWLAIATFVGGIASNHRVFAQDADAVPSADDAGPPSAESAPAEGAVQLSPVPTPAEVASAAPAEASDEAEPVAGERPTPGARARLAVWQTVYGAVYATEICALAGCDSARGVVGSLFLGMGAGATTSLLATRGRGVEPRRAVLYNTAPLMGTFLTYEIFAIAGRREPTTPDDRTTFLHGKALLGSVLAGQLGSYALAFGADRLFQPTAGDVIFAESTSLWLTSLTTLAIWDARGLGNNTEVRRAHAGYLVATVGGLVGGGFLAHRYGISASRTMVVNAAGILGGGVGFLSSFLIYGENVFDHRHVFAWSTIGGSVGGIALAMGLTRSLDHRGDRGRNVSMGISPELGGASVQVAMRLP